MRTAPFIALAIPLSLAACASTGDFGRPEPRRLAGEVSATASTVVDLYHSRRAAFALSADESALRDAAAELDAPIRRGPIWTTRQSHPERYADMLSAQGFSDGPTRIAAITTDLEAEHQRLDRFAAASVAVVAADRARLRGLDREQWAIASDTRRRALERVGENQSLIRVGIGQLAERREAFAHALAVTAVETPGGDPAHAERLLMLLAERAERLVEDLAAGAGAGQGAGHARHSHKDWQVQTRP